MPVNIRGLLTVVSVIIVSIGVSRTQNCPNYCISCFSDRNCSSCVSGKYGLVCELNCTAPCSNGSCNKDTGRCLDNCLSNQYLDLDSGVCRNCSSGCGNCTYFSNCSSCEGQHHWGSACQYDCPHCYGACSKENGCSEGCEGKYYRIYNDKKSGFECLRCPESCEACLNATSCLTCELGYWGPLCQHNCSGCDSYCSQSTGCIDDCVPGYYRHQVDSGLQCIECPDDNCLICSNTTHCEKCQSGYYPNSDHKCSLCPPRCSSCTNYMNCLSCTRSHMWGDTCEFECTGCSRNCSKFHGCIIGCDRGYFKTPSRWHDGGYECRRCPETCSTCSNMSKCITCKEGYWGTSCHHNCSSCSGDCSSEFGCMSACPSSYFSYRTDNGFQCEECPDTNCVMCADATECKECKTGYYLANGNCVNCYENCKHGNCNSKNGTCNEGCEDGWSGHSCNQSCPANCLHCDRFNKLSCYACSPGFYGESCDSLCSAYCKSTGESKICQKSNGTCFNGCEDGHWGDKCTMECSKGCLENHCNELTGRCLNGCEENFYGSHCNEECTCSQEVQDHDHKQSVRTNGTGTANQHSAKNDTAVVALSVVTGATVLVAALSITANIILLKRSGLVSKQRNNTLSRNFTQEQQLDNNDYQDLNRREIEDASYAIADREYENTF